MINEQRLRFIYEALLDVECELQTLEGTEEWFVSSCHDRILSSIEMCRAELGIEEEEDYEQDDEEFEQLTLELRFDD